MVKDTGFHAYTEKLKGTISSESVPSFIFTLTCVFILWVVSGLLFGKILFPVDTKVDSSRVQRPARERTPRTEESTNDAPYCKYRFVPTAKVLVDILLDKRISVGETLPLLPCAVPSS